MCSHSFSSPHGAEAQAAQWLHAHDAVAAAPERCAEIDLGALAANVARVRELVGEAHIMAIVKAQAYGHGAVACARAALDAGATWVGTAHVSEALELRAAGIEAPALCWLHTSDTDFEAAVANGIDIGVSGWELEPVIEAARAVGVRRGFTSRSTRAWAATGAPRRSGRSLLSVRPRQSVQATSASWGFSRTTRWAMSRSIPRTMPRRAHSRTRSPWWRRPG